MRDDEPRAAEQRAVVRIDARPSGKKFQGVWLELASGARRVVDHRARPMWRSFEDREVWFTGHCYAPFGQAIGATHFEVETLRLVSPGASDGPLVALGPELWLRGEFVEHAFPEGSKLAGGSEPRFRADDGVTYRLAEGSASAEFDARRTVLARRVDPSPTYAAQPGGPQLWVLDVRAADALDDPARARRRVRCPEE